MVTARIDMHRIKDGKELFYLEDWYCPLEAARTGIENLSIKPYPDAAISQFTPTLMLKSSLMRKHSMAGF